MWHWADISQPPALQEMVLEFVACTEETLLKYKSIVHADQIYSQELVSCAKDLTNNCPT